MGQSQVCQHPFTLWYVAFSCASFCPHCCSIADRTTGKLPRLTAKITKFCIQCSPNLILPDTTQTDVHFVHKFTNKWSRSQTCNGHAADLHERFLICGLTTDLTILQPFSILSFQRGGSLQSKSFGEMCVLVSLTPLVSVSIRPPRAHDPKRTVTVCTRPKNTVGFGTYQHDQN